MDDSEMRKYHRSPAGMEAGERFGPMFIRMLWCAMRDSQTLTIATKTLTTTGCAGKAIIAVIAPASGRRHTGRKTNMAGVRTISVARLKSRMTA